MGILNYEVEGVNLPPLLLSICFHILLHSPPRDTVLLPDFYTPHLSLSDQVIGRIQADPKYSRKLLDRQDLWQVLPIHDLFPPSIEVLLVR